MGGEASGGGAGRRVPPWLRVCFVCRPFQLVTMQSLTFFIVLLGLAVAGTLPMRSSKLLETHRN